MASDTKSDQNFKTVVIIEATGAQGGGCIRALSEYPDFKVIDLTRNGHDEKAKSLLASYANVTVKKADMDTEALLDVFEGVHGVFVAVSNFWDQFNPQKELEHVRIMDDVIDYILDSRLARELLIGKNLPAGTSCGRSCS